MKVSTKRLEHEPRPHAENQPARIVTTLAGDGLFDSKSKQKALEKGERRIAFLRKSCERE